MFTLTVDLAGPVKPGLDVTSKGALGKGLKYMIVARYVLPAEFVKAYSGRLPPEDGGMEEKQDATGNPEQPMGQCGKELTKPSLLPPREEGEDDQIDRENPMGQCGEELTKPSLLPPREEGDPFSFCEDEPGEQCPLFSEDEPGEQCPTVHHEEPQDDRSCGFAGGTGTQRRQYKDYEDSLYDPSEAEELDDILYLEAHGLPVYRLHSDKGETFNHSIRSWMRDKGIRGTWSEPGIPSRQRASGKYREVGEGQGEDSTSSVWPSYQTLAHGGGSSYSTAACSSTWMEVQSAGAVWGHGTYEAEGL